MRTLPKIVTMLAVLSSSLVAESPTIRQVLDPGEPTQGDSLIWTGLMPKAWKELGKLAGVEKIDLKNKSDGKDNPAAISLNDAAGHLENLLPADTKVWAGPPNQQLIDQINTDLSKLFPGANRKVSFGPSSDPYALTAVAALNHRVHFARHFFSSNKKTMSFRPSRGEAIQVPYFGTRGAANKVFGPDEVRVHYYRPLNNFIVEFKTTANQESLWIVRSPDASTLQSHVDAVRQIQAKPDDPVTTSLTPEDTLMVPRIHLENTRDFAKDLEGTFLDKNQQPYQIVDAQQWIDFQLDEAGFRVKAKAELSADPFGGPPPTPPKPKPRRLICDGPFSILLWRTGSHLPYAAFYFDGGKWQQ